MTLTPFYLAGHESGLPGVDMGAVTADGSPTGTLTVISAAARNGGYGLRVNQTGTQCSAWRDFGASTGYAKVVGRIAFRFNTLPTADAVTFFRLSNASDVGRCSIDTSIPVVEWSARTQ